MRMRRRPRHPRPRPGRPRRRWWCHPLPLRRRRLPWPRRQRGPASPAPGTPAGGGGARSESVVGFAAVVAFNRQPTPKQEEAPEVALARVARENADAVALVVLIHPKLNNGQPEPIATAWAVGPHVFATNSHVTTPVKEVLDNGGSVYLVINRNPDKKLKVTKAVIHPRYDKEHLHLHGQQHAE